MKEENRKPTTRKENLAIFYSLLCAGLSPELLPTGIDRAFLLGR